MIAVEFILYVKDLAKSKRFYTTLLDKSPRLDVPGMVEFQLSDSTVLGLMPNNGIAKIICPALPHPSEGNNAPRCELYLKTADAVQLLENGMKAGGRVVSLFAPRDWGDDVAYITDFDGHVIALAEPSDKE